MDPLLLQRMRFSITDSSKEIERFTNLNSASLGKNKEKLKAACQDFEAIFIKMVLNSMQKTIDRSNLIERNLGQEIFEDMLYTEYAKVMSRRGSIGIADLLYRQLAPYTADKN
ncbi:MAG: rod-binding protein [Spirochaetales bacterium]